MLALFSSSKKSSSAFEFTSGTIKGIFYAVGFLQLATRFHLIYKVIGCMPTANFRDKQDESLKRLENFDWEIGDI